MRTTQFPLVDRIVGGLAGKLDRWHDEEGLTYLEIRDKLRADYDVEVSPETLRRWHLRLIEEAAS